MFHLNHWKYITIMSGSLEQLLKRDSKNCCELLKKHKNKVKGGHKISLEFTKMLRTQLCRSCYDKATTHAETDKEKGQSTSSKQINDNTYQVETDDIQDQSREIMNQCLQALGESPLKTHALPPHQRVSYAKRKVEGAIGSLKQSFAKAVGIDEYELMKKDSHEVLKKETLQKAEDLDKLMEAVKVKLALLDVQ